MQLLRERRRVTAGGMTYEVGPATLATVELATTLLAIQVATCLDRRAELDAGQAGAILRTCRPPDLSRVLATCVSGPPLPEHIEALAVLGAAVLELTDVISIADALQSLQAEPPGEPEGEDISPGELAVVACAARFGCAPHEVYDWPYTAFLAAVRCLPLLRVHMGEVPAQQPKRTVPFDAMFGGQAVQAKAEPNPKPNG